jgi:hypothetical protein
MEGLLDREEALRERERRAHLDREAALQSQVEQLLRYISQSQPRPEKGTMLLGTPAPPEPTRTPNCQRLEKMAAEMAARPSAENKAHGTFDYADTRANSASEAVAQAMNFVKEGHDVLEDIDLKMPRRRHRRAGHDSDAGSDSYAATPVATTTSPTPSARVAQSVSSSPTTAAQRATLSQANTQPLRAEGGSSGERPDPAAAASVDVPVYTGPVEVSKAPHNGPPPRLAQGDDDIFWVSALHVCALPALLSMMPSNNSSHLFALVSLDVRRGLLSMTISYES